MRNMDASKHSQKQKIMINVLSAVGLIATIAFMVYGFKTGIFTSEEAMKSFLERIGVIGHIVFIVIQIIQVVFPIVPCAAGCAVGVMVFGPYLGFVYNYVGICIGSILAFLIARKYGMTIIRAIFSEKTIDKYTKWLDSGKKYEKFLTVAIFLPVAPDDFLCYLSGTTSISLKKFATIIFLGKPLALILYSMGITAVMQYIFSLL